MEKFQQEIAEEVKAVLERTQYVIRGEKKVTVLFNKTLHKISYK